MPDDRHALTGIPAARNGRPQLPLDSLSVGIQEIDRQGVIVYANRALHQILGYEFPALVGRRISELKLTGEDARDLEGYLDHLLTEQPAPTPYFTQSRRGDGTAVRLRVDWDYKRDRDGRPVGFVSVFTDISDRRKAEELLEKRSQGLSAFLAVSRSLGSSVELRRVLQAAVEGVTGLVGLDSAAVYLLEGEELHLQATVPPLPPDFPDAMRIARLAEHPHIQRVIRTGRPLLQADASQEELSPAERAIIEARNLSTLLYIPLVSDEHRLGAFIVGSVGRPVPLSDEQVDLSLTLGSMAALAVTHTRLFNESRHYAAQLEQALVEQLRAEEEREGLLEQLAQAQKLESIGRLAGGVAHDFNNLLGVILGYTELALEQTSPREPLHADLQEVLGAARRSAAITQQLLAFARKQTIRPRPLDLNEKVAGTLGMLGRLLGEDIELDWTPGEDLPPVFLDPSQLDQVLINLCANARDAIAGVGRVAIATSRARRDVTQSKGRPDFVPDEHVMLSVSDDGPGMDAETLASVFEPFFTTKRAGTGTGLGLATVYGIVQQNGAVIDVSSEPGQGTCFRLYLPRYEGAVQAPRPSQDDRAAAAVGETVLLVEDEEPVRRLVTRQLERLGYTVLSADTPARALSLAQEHAGRLHLLLSDVVMPEMNGRDLAKRVRELHRGLAVLYMSGYTTEVIAHRGRLEAGVHFIQKPFTQVELAERVRRALDGQAD